MNLSDLITYFKEDKTFLITGITGKGKINCDLVNDYYGLLSINKDSIDIMFSSYKKIIKYGKEKTSKLVCFKRFQEICHEFIYNISGKNLRINIAYNLEIPHTSKSGDVNKLLEEELKGKTIINIINSKIERLAPEAIFNVYDKEDVKTYDLNKSKYYEIFNELLELIKKDFSKYCFKIELVKIKFNWN